MINEVLLGLNLHDADKEETENPESIKKINQILETELQGVYDFNFYGLTDESIKALLQTLMAENKI